MRPIAIAFVLLAGCAPQRPPAATPSVAPAPAPDHPDYARLKLFRNYLRLVRVGPFAHHFTVWYHDEEPCVCEAVVEGQRVTLEHCFWGGVAMRPQRVPPIAHELQPIADAVWQRVRERWPGASGPLVQYHGEYREVTFAEAIPLVPQRAGGLFASVSLASDAALSRWTRVVGDSSGIGALCGVFVGNCKDPPQWIRFDAPARGQSLLEALRKKLEAGSVDDDALARVLLHAAQAREGVPLDALGDGDTLLPEGLEQRVQAVVRIRAVAARRDGTDAIQPLLLPLDGRDIARGDAHADAHADVAGRGFDVSFALRGEPATASGDVARELTLRVRDSDGRSFGWIYPAKAHLLVDGERAAATSVDILYPGNAPEQQVRGRGDIDHYVIGLDGELRPAWRDEP